MISTRAILMTLCGVALAAGVLIPAESPTGSGGGVNLLATTANVSAAPDAVRFEILRWSTQEERDRLAAAWELKTPSPGPGSSGSKGGGRTKGSAPAANNLTPPASLARALQETTTVGYLWSSEIAGYALRYAGRLTNADASQRIVLITQRRLGAVNQRWNLTAAPASGDAASSPYDFSVIELHLNAKGEGEGKASLAGKVSLDTASKAVVLENYDALPPLFRNIHLQPAKPATGKPPAPGKP